jgi:hypothetical protein
LSLPYLFYLLGRSLLYLFICYLQVQTQKNETLKETIPSPEDLISAFLISISSLGDRGFPDD